MKHFSNSNVIGTFLFLKFRSFLINRHKIHFMSDRNRVRFFYLASVSVSVKCHLVASRRRSFRDSDSADAELRSVGRSVPTSFSSPGRCWFSSPYFCQANVSVPWRRHIMAKNNHLLIKSDVNKDEQLIALVEQNPVLYTQTHPKYMDSKYKQKVWDTIGAFIEEDSEYFTPGNMQSRW